MGKKEKEIEFILTFSAMPIFFVLAVRVFISLIQSIQEDNLPITGIFLFAEIFLIFCEIFSARKFRGLWNEFRIESQRKKIRKRRDMYQFIADGDQWGYFPIRTTHDAQFFSDYIKYEIKFMGYRHYVDSEIKDKYQWLVNEIKSGIPAKEEDEARRVYHEIIVPFAKDKVEELNKMLKSLG